MMNLGCGDSIMAEAEFFGGVHHTSSQVLPGVPEGEAITDQVEVTYNQEEDASIDNLLTFAVDVDTASYTIARSYLLGQQLPPKEVIRVEEFINFFDYQDEAPTTLKDSPFAVVMDAAKAPFAENRTLLRIGIKGYEVPNTERPDTNLVFLIDTSGSMSSSIDLVRESLGLLLDNLNPQDSIAIVTYAGNSKIALSPTPVSERSRIINAMNRLSSGGGTNGAGGIITAYRLAEESFKEDGLNRVVLCTDGDFNVGVTGQALYDLIEEKREGGVTLSVLGFGMRYNDSQME
jgi:Ca-activated chloride channel family protein